MKEEEQQKDLFMCEPIKLRVTKEIHDVIFNNHQCKISILTEPPTHFNILFPKARLEFFKDFPTKNINWKEFSDKTKSHLPAWRKNKTTVPETRNY